MIKKAKELTIWLHILSKYLWFAAIIVSYLISEFPHTHLEILLTGWFFIWFNENS